MGKERKRLGNLGEEIAIKFLIRRGWQILQRNYRSRWGEIDIVAKDKDFIVFVEVKTTRVEHSLFPQESITQRKQMQISKMALSFLKRFSLLDSKARFDIVAVWIREKGFLGPKIELIENAFPLPYSL